MVGAKTSLRLSAGVTLLLLMGCLLAGVASASGEKPQDVDDAVALTGGFYQKGRMELAAIAGFGTSHGLWDGVDGARFLALGARFGRVLSEPRGPGFLQGNLELAGERLPVFLVDPGDTTYGASMTLLGRHFFMPASSWRPYAILGIGALATKRRIPEESSAINFTPQAGLGVAFNYGDSVEFYVEYRVHHISAAGGPQRGIRASIRATSNSARAFFAGELGGWKFQPPNSVMSKIR